MLQVLDTIIFSIWKWNYYRIPSVANPGVVKRGKSDEREKHIRSCICVKEVLKGKDPHEVMSVVKSKVNNNVPRSKLAQATSARIQALDPDRDITADDSCSQPQCPICLETYKVGDNLAWSKKCKYVHVFHEDCIKLWLKDHNECPLCRVDMLVPSGMKRNSEVTA